MKPEPQRSDMVASECPLAPAVISPISIDQLAGEGAGVRGEHSVRSCSAVAVAKFRLVIALSIAAVFAPTTVAIADDLESREELAFKQAAALADPSIVRIDTVGGLDLVGDVLTGTGPTTGVVVATDGYIITSSFNFVSQPAGIIVTLPDGRRFPAEVVATDDARKLTLLRIDVARERTALQPLAPAPRKDLRVGQWSIALGRTYDLAIPNLSVGILSAVNRVWGRAVQTDAKISPANYGGPLVDLDGRGIGILVPLSPQATDETAGVEWYDGGIGFAIPLEDVYASLARLKQGDDLQPGLLGVSFPDQGVLAGEANVDRVRPESPADKAGLQVGDVIIEVNGQSVRRVPELRHIIGRLYAGDVVQLAYRRGDESLRAEATLVGELVPYESGYLGLLPERTAAGEATEGVTIRGVLATSPAAEAGLQRRDVIVACDGSPVTTAADLLDRIGRKRPGETCELLFRREQTLQTIKVALSALPDVVPQQLPSAAISAAVEGAVPAELLGRTNITLPGEAGGKYWRYVPTQYNPAYPHGLVVWLHPAGDTQEAAILKAWQQHCDRRGLILVAPLAGDVAGWTAGETEIIREVVDETQRQFTIDPQRICVHGMGAGGRLAWDVAFKHRDLFRAVIAVSAPLREAPPDNDPDFRLQTCSIAGANDPLRDKVERSVEVLRRLKFPARLIAIPDAGEAYPPEETIDELARWLDALDRI
jgi:serine protease Do